MSHLHLHHHAALRAGRGREGAQGGVGPRSPESGRAAGGGPHAAHGLGELRRRRRSADASWPHHGGARALVHRYAAPRCGMRGDHDAGLAAGGGPGVWLAAARAQLGQSEPQRAESVDGALLRRHGDARRHDALGRSRHDAAAGAARRSGSGDRGALEGDACTGTVVAPGLPSALMLVRAHVQQARG
jgi:hypothetical protein